jgi:alkylhydroperoxidase family enzyme
LGLFSKHNIEWEAGMAVIAISNSRDAEALDFYTTYPDLGASAAGLMAAVYSEANPLPPEVREAVRMRIALLNDCVVCKTARPMPELGDAFYDNIADFARRPDVYSPAQRAAMEFAELFARDHLAIGDDLFARLREHFDERQVAALTISAGYFVAFGRLTRVLLLDHACPLAPAA